MVFTPKKVCRKDVYCMSAGFHTINLKKIKKIALSIAIPLLIGGVSTFLSGDQSAVYNNLMQPPLAPPPWLFGVVWPILYVLMGISAYLVSVSNAPEKEKNKAFVFYWLQLAFNFFWSIWFFRFQLFGFSFLWLIVLLILAIANAVMFYDKNRAAGWLLVPYIAWLSFAAYLNYMIWVLN